MKNIISKFGFVFILMLVLTGKSFSQVNELRIGVDGFTCSLCAKGVEEEFKAMSFVKKVNSDISNSMFTLYFKKNSSIDINRIKDGVVDGGFTVRNINIFATGTIQSDGSNYTLVTGNSPALKLNKVEGVFSDGDKVKISGKVNVNNYSVNVVKINKL
ncbi:hypothetical protein BH10BAC5_BH10BAC5_07260 [soil metagenome]